MDAPFADIDSIRERLRSLGRGAWPEVGRRSGIALSTIKKVAYGQTLDPSLSTANAIARALNEIPDRPNPGADPSATDRCESRE